MGKPIYTPENTWQTPIIGDDTITSEYQYNINYNTIDVKMHNKANAAPEHRIVLPNSCSFTMVVDLPHNVLNKLDDYRLNYGPLEYETSHSIFKESYILSVRPPWDSIDYIVSASYDSSGSMAFVTQSNGDVIVIGDDDRNGLTNEEYFNVQAPFLVDASGSRTTATLEITTKKIQGKDKDIYRYTADSTWLDNAVYPVVIDPSVLLYSTTNVVAFYQSNNRKVARTSNGNLVTVQGERTTWRLRALIARGDDFSTTTAVNIETGTTYLDYSNIILADDGSLVATYRSRNSSNKICSKRSTDNGLTWSAEYNMTSAIGAWGGNGVLTCKSDDGALWTWAESGTGTYEMGLFKSTNHGVSWTFLGGGATRKWYGDLCYDRKNNKIKVIGCDQSGGTIAWYRTWDITGGSWDIAATAVSTTGVASHDRAIMGGMACDNEGNTIFQVRVRHTADSLYYDYVHMWPSGGTPGLGAVITLIGGTSNVYGPVRCDRSGAFHDLKMRGATVANSGVYYAKYKYGQTPVYNLVANPNSNNNTNQINMNMNNHNEESIYENQIMLLEHNTGTSTYFLYHHDNIAQQVGPTIMPIIG